MFLNFSVPFKTF